jgi:FdhD protein
VEKRSSEIEISVVSGDDEQKRKDAVIHEEEVVVRIGKEVHKFHCIPTDLEEMILGNLKSRGINASFPTITKIAENEFKVDLPLVEGLINNPQRCDSNKKLTRKEVFTSVEKLNQHGLLFKRTGCTHVVGICGDGREIFVEDTSRHCAIDKAIGLAIRDGVDLSDSFLVASCRQTASAIKKAIFCGIPIVISIAAPTDLAVKEANRYGVTLIGFADSKRFNVYSHDWRVQI